MKILCIAFLLLVCSFASTNALAVEVVRDGDILALKDGDNWCYVFDWGRIDDIIPEGGASVLEAVTAIATYELEVTDAHRQICGIGVAYSRGFNFRLTPGYVNDGADALFAGAGVTYPTAAGNEAYGWESGTPCFRDRSQNGPVELAGIACIENNGEQATFRIDIPAPGIYAIRLAVGDASWQQEHVYVQVLDGDEIAIPSRDSAGVNLNAGEYIDAAGTKFNTPTTWMSANTPITYEFKTSIVRLVIGQPTATGRVSVVSHISVSTAK